MHESQSMTRWMVAHACCKQVSIICYVSSSSFHQFVICTRLAGLHLDKKVTHTHNMRLPNVWPYQGLVKQHIVQIIPLVLF